MLPIGIMLIGASALVARLFYVQVWYHEEISKRVSKLIYRERNEAPCRGTITDANGNVLAMSSRCYSVFVDPNMVEDSSALNAELKKVKLALPQNLDSYKGKTSYMLLAENLDTQSARKVKALNLRGIGLTQGFVRSYPEGRLASHVLGIVGKNTKGLEGVEYAADEYLSGTAISSKRYRDGRGKEISEKLINPENLRGGDVKLTIDKNLQFIAEQEIDKAYKQSGSKKAIIIIQDPSNGEILAMASRPSFSPDEYGGYEKIRNPAISDIFEPGSTFKAVTLAAALQENLVKRNEMIWCENGKYSVYDHVIKDHEKRGLLSVDEIMEYSSNIGVAKIAQRIGKERLYSYIKLFGFNSITGIDLPGEARGLLKETSKWSGLSLPIIAFGQEIGVTPLQIINAYSAIFNGGELLEPRIIKEVKNPDGEIIYKSERRVVRRVVSRDVADQLKEILVSVVEKGTGQMARVANYTCGGKTGTAQKRDKATNKYSTSAYVASFCGAIPAKDPKMTILVILDEPQGDYWASSRAAPVFSKVASRALGCLQVLPDVKPVFFADARYNRLKGE